MKFSAFEHKLLKVFKEDYPGFEKIWVSCSFGADSLVLLNALRSINPVLNLDLNVVHIHHGKSDDPRINEYRDEALKAAKAYCLNNDLNLKVFVSNKNLKSEKDCRDFRFKSYENLDGGNIFLGHHKQDLVETLLLKLIRGVGEQGFNFGNESFENFSVYRPLLGFLKKELLEEVVLKELKPAQDPSNNSDKYLRNWVRNTWLEDLEKHRAGSIKSLGESLINIQTSLLSKNETDVFNEYIKKGSIALDLWLGLSLSKKRELVALVLKSKKVKGFTSGHVNETIKQLDLIKKEHTFNLAGLKWNKDSKSIEFKKVASL